MRERPKYNYNGLLKEVAMNDIELETRIREELYYGCVEQAKALIEQINSPSLKSYMREVVQDYECG